MWSGPRNLSTAMMYSFGNRSDCSVWDEPFYAAYLAKTGLDHPMLAEILAAGEHDDKLVANRCIGDIPEGKQVFYQKHMAHHMLPGFDREWMRDVVNVFLIRDPAKVIASYHAKRENPTLDDIGFRQQAEIFKQVVEKNGTIPAVIDCGDILANPEQTLRILCDFIDLDFQQNMLQWPKGRHQDDGAWADHWYKSVWESSGFSIAPDMSKPDLPTSGEVVLKEAYPYYEMMLKYQIAAAT